MSYIVSTGPVGFYRGQDHPGGVPITICGVPAVAPEDSLVQQEQQHRFLPTAEAGGFLGAFAVMVLRELLAVAAVGEVMDKECDLKITRRILGALCGACLGVGEDEAGFPCQACGGRGTV